MTAYHSVLLGLTALAMLLCLWQERRAVGCAGAVDAVLGFLAMGVGMLPTAASLVWGAAGVLAWLGARALVRRPGCQPMALARGLSSLMMGAIMAALAVLNSGAICGESSLSLLTWQGITLLPMPPYAELLVLMTVGALPLYALVSGVLVWQLARQPTVRQHVGAATLGMAFS